MVRSLFFQRFVLLAGLWAFGATGQAQYVGPYEKTMRFRVYGQGAQPISAKRGQVKIKASEGKIEEEDSVFAVETPFFSPEPVITMEGDQGIMVLGIERKTRPVENPPVLGLDYRPGKFKIQGRWAYLFSEELRTFDLDNRNLNDFREGQEKEPLATARFDTLNANGRAGWSQYWMEMEQGAEYGDLFLLSSENVKGNRSNARGFLFYSANGQVWEEKPLDIAGRNVRSDHLYVASSENLYLRVRESSKRPTVMYHSGDAGGSWTLDAEAERLGIYDLFFPKGEEAGYALGHKEKGTQLYFRDNDQEAWELKNSFKEHGMLLVHVQNSILYLYHPNRTDFFQSLDGGERWTTYSPKSISPSTYGHHRFFGFQKRGQHRSMGVLFDGSELGVVETDYRVRSWGNRSVALLGHGSDYLLASGDGGQTWSSTPLNLNGRALDFTFLAPRKVLLVGPYLLHQVSF